MVLRLATDYFLGENDALGTGAPGLPLETNARSFAGWVRRQTARQNRFWRACPPDK
jgi:hypothetical protein